MQKGFPMKTLRPFIFSSHSFFIFFLTTAFCLSAAAFAASADARSADARPADGPAPKGWNAEVKTIHYRVEADQSWQPALFYIPESARESQAAVPLIVGLHTWSSNYTQPNPYFYEGAKKYGWVMICPHFRGPNWTPSACGSELVSADILAAVEYAKANANIDPDRIYLMGMSGGGHCSMLMAGRHPEVWAGVCAWVGISDLAKWHASTKAKGFNYWKHLESACGGAPGTSAEVDEEYRKRSPLTYLKNAGSVPLCLNHGIHDGHAGSVPASAKHLGVQSSRRAGEKGHGRTDRLHLAHADHPGRTPPGSAERPAVRQTESSFPQNERQYAAHDFRRSSFRRPDGRFCVAGEAEKKPARRLDGRISDRREGKSGSPFWKVKEDPSGKMCAGVPH